MKTLVLCNQKGGVGKSAVATLLAHHLAQRGRRVLAIDLDHQGNLSKPLRLSGRASPGAATADTLLTGAPPVLPPRPFVLVPGDRALLGLERQPALHTPFARHFRTFLASVDADFDVCVIDTNPHVHISVRAESKHGRRLNPRKTDLHRWRETFAEKLRERGVEAEASRQATRGSSRNYDPLWRIKAREEGRLRTTRPSAKSSAGVRKISAESLEAWQRLKGALEASHEPADHQLARGIADFFRGPIERSRNMEWPAPIPIHLEVYMR